MLAARGAPSASSREALQTLCESYWEPVYHHVRRRGMRPEDAEDLTQAFFARLLVRGDLATVRPEAVRLRAFLLACLNDFPCNEWARARAQMEEEPT